MPMVLLRRTDGPRETHHVGPPARVRVSKIVARRRGLRPAAPIRAPPPLVETEPAADVVAHTVGDGEPDVGNQRSLNKRCAVTVAEPHPRSPPSNLERLVSA